MKRCSKCHIEKELSEFNKAKKNKDGYMYMCRNCAKEVSRLKYESILTDPEKLKKLREKEALYRKTYKDRISANNKRYRIKNSDKVKERDAEYRKTHKEYQRNWEKENRLHIREKKREYYSTEHGKSILVSLSHKRRAIKMNADDGTITKEYLKKIADNTKYCIFTGVELTADNRHLDHIIPLSRGGKHSADNVRFISSKANLLKGNKLDEEFTPILYDYLIRKSSKEILLQRYAS